MLWWHSSITIYSNESGENFPFNTSSFPSEATDANNKSTSASFLSPVKKPYESSDLTLWNTSAACRKISSRCATNKTRLYGSESKAARYVFPIPVAAWTIPFSAPSFLLFSNSYSASICTPLGSYSFFNPLCFSSSPCFSYLARSLATAGRTQLFAYFFSTVSVISTDLL